MPPARRAAASLRLKAIQDRYNDSVDDVRHARLAAIAKSVEGRVVMVGLLERLVAQNEEIIGLLRYQIPDTEEPEYDNTGRAEVGKDGAEDAEDEGGEDDGGEVDLLEAAEE
ncbi:hypothetical protein GP486_007141 [Trichoglossum hirsutum]|uniref:Uncharacterized protein n=1 Tax=Trichoglossum hirsutum TaxID=265104 RepID=A0A9P8I6Y0_9PEZI|nr:hypothetical protein GP486_007141 [Trichoglossum hirsutum]